MKMPPFRTLIVEDHEGFSRFMSLTLQEQAQCQVISQVSDGLQAIEKAEQLEPDLIVLDLGLPKLNGMEVARRLSKICPDAKMLIVSQDSSSDIVQAVLRIGVHGYLLKSDAADLPLAVDAILHDTVFVSPHLNGITRRSTGPNSSSN